MNILAELRRRFAVALVDATGDGESGALAEMVLPSQDAKFGDYQANCAMPLGKKLGKPPREIAAGIVAKLDVADLCEPPQIAGPGFINLKLRSEFLTGELQRSGRDLERLGVPVAATPRRYVVDFSAPNVAKPMHVGHIRSTVIGDALCRVLKFLGHGVTSDNHIGDWGTQFGMIIYGWNKWGNEEKFAENPIAELTWLYRKVNRIIEYHNNKKVKVPRLKETIAGLASELSGAESAPAISKKLATLRNRKEEFEFELSEIEAEIRRDEQEPGFLEELAAHQNAEVEVLKETAKLHHGNEENLKLWNKFIPPSVEVNEQIYQRLGVKFDEQRGESKYESELPNVVADLKSKGLVRESQGAQCIFLEGFEAPFIIQKQDGAFLYATTDLATIKYRMEKWQPDAILYVVDHRQSDHFKQLFATARLWRYTDVDLQHVSFGTVLGDDGRPFKTRSSVVLSLMGLLDEAVKRAYAIAAQSDALTTDEERRAVAERIGIGAIKYADLAHNRTSDYKFSYDKMLAMTGNTAAYMQYSYARVSSIFGKGGVDVNRLRLSDAPILLDHPAERALAVAILQFSEALDRVVADYRPNNLTDYLFDLAGKYAGFFENCPVLKAETDELRTSRLLLCDLTARTLKQGLNLLGIETVERM